MARRWALAAWTSVALAVGACGGSDDPDPIVPPGDDDDTDTEPPLVDTAPEGGFIDANAFGVTARFAYDPAVGQHVRYAPPGEGLAPMSLTVVLLDSEAVLEQVVDETTSCTVTLEFDGPAPMAPWVGEEGPWTGFDLPPDPTVRDRCRFYGLPGSFGGDAGAHVAKWGWGIGVGAIDPYVFEQLRQQVSASEWAALEPNVVGGVLRAEVLTEGFTGGDGLVEQGTALGYEVDGNLEIVAGGTGGYRPIPREQVPGDDGPGVARGYYEVTLGPFGPGEMLTRDPGAGYRR